MSSRELRLANDAAQADAWAKLSRDLGGRYRLHLERKDAQGDLRYVAVARSLDVRPYAVVTADFDEFHRALGTGVARPGTPETQPRMKR
jgi:hypothetical protein